MASEDYPYCKDAIVEVGKDRWLTLCCRVALVPGQGQVWHTTNNRFVLSGVDIHGRTTWSILGVSLAEFMVAMKIPSSSFVDGAGGHIEITF